MNVSLHGFRKWGVIALLSALWLPSLHAAPVRDDVARAVKAMGGAAALQALHSIAIVAQGTTYRPAPDGKTAAPYGRWRFVVQRDLVSGATRIDWEHSAPGLGPAVYRYSEIMSGGMGYFTTADLDEQRQVVISTGPSEPAPGRFMAPDRVAQNLRELARQSPRLLLEMSEHKEAVAPLPAQRVGERRLPAVSFATTSARYVVMFDPHSGLPVVIRTNEFGQPYDLVLGDWRDAGGMKLACALTYRLNGRDVMRIQYEQVTLNPALDAETFSMPTPARSWSTEPVGPGGLYQGSVGGADVVTSGGIPPGLLPYVLLKMK